MPPKLSRAAVTSASATPVGLARRTRRRRRDRPQSLAPRASDRRRSRQTRRPRPPATNRSTMPRPIPPPPPVTIATLPSSNALTTPPPAERAGASGIQDPPPGNARQTAAVPGRSECCSKHRRGARGRYASATARPAASFRPSDSRGRGSPPRSPTTHRGCSAARSRRVPRTRGACSPPADAITPELGTRPANVWCSTRLRKRPGTIASAMSGASGKTIASTSIHTTTSFVWTRSCRSTTLSHGVGRDGSSRCRTTTKLVAVRVRIAFERGTGDVEEFEVRAVRDRAEHPPLRPRSGAHDSRLRRAIVR